VWAEQEAEISDPQLESSCLGGWIWEPGNQTLAAAPPAATFRGIRTTPEVVSRRQSGTSHSRRSTMTVTPCFVFMGISCAPSSTLVPPGSTAIAGKSPSTSWVAIRPTTGTFVVEEPPADVIHRPDGLVAFGPMTPALRDLRCVRGSPSLTLLVDGEKGEGRGAMRPLLPLLGRWAPCRATASNSQRGLDR